MQAAASQQRHERLHPLGVLDGRTRVRPARGFGRIDTVLPVHVIQALGVVVVGLQRVVIDRPRGRDAVHVLDGLEVLASQPVEHAAPELRVAADAIMRVRLELPPAVVEPALRRAVAQLLPHCVGAPVFLFLRHEVAALDQEDPRAGPGKGVRHRAAAGAGADDDDVVV